MTNLQRWIMYLLLFCIPYFATLFWLISKPYKEESLFLLQLVPFVIVIMFGLYAAGTVLYRTMTFNDCPAAAKELLEQIQEARKDLTAKGFIFRD